MASSSSPAVTLQNINRLSADVFVTRKGGIFRSDYSWLVKALGNLSTLCNESNEILPNDYQEALLKPFFDFIISLGEVKFEEIFSKDDKKKLTDEQLYYRKYIPEITEALLQRNYEGIYYKTAFDDLLAFQAIVSDLYKKIAIKKVGKLVQQPLSPLVKWSPSKAPHTFPSINKHLLNKLKVGIVSLPPEHRTGGLLAWGVLGHEVAGHNFLRSIPNLLSDLKATVNKTVQFSCKTQMLDELKTKQITSFMEHCTEEIASDVLGTLAMGPISAVCLLGYSRGARDSGKLSKKALVKRTTHLPDILRVLTCSTIIEKCLEISEKTNWIKTINDEVKKDYETKDTVLFLKTTDPTKEIADESEFYPINIDIAIQVANAAAEAIATTKLRSLKTTLKDIVCWAENPDELLAYTVQRAIQDQTAFPNIHLYEKINACHVVTGAVMAALQPKASTEKCFITMKNYLLKAYLSNTYWVPS